MFNFIAFYLLTKRRFMGIMVWYRNDTNPCLMADGREDKWLRSVLRITNPLRAHSEDLKSSVQEAASSQRFVKEKLMKSLL